MAARFISVAGVIVTFEPLTVASPVKSSMRSSWPAARLEFVRGSVKSLTTVVVEELAKFRFSPAPTTVTVVARLTSMPSPALPVMVRGVVIVDVKGPGNVATQTVPEAQAGLISDTLLL